MISTSFYAFKMAIRDEFQPDDFVGVITKERVDQIVSNIKKGECVNETFCIKKSEDKIISEEERNLEKDWDFENWYGLQIEWNNKDRTGIMTAKYQGGTNWYGFNLGSFHLNHLYELVPDIEPSTEEKLRAVAKEEILNGLMKWRQ